MVFARLKAWDIDELSNGVTVGLPDGALIGWLDDGEDGDTLACVEVSTVISCHNATG